MNYALILNIIFSLLVLGLAVTFLVVRYALNLRSQIDSEWQKLLILIRKRSDLIPLLRQRWPESQENEWKEIIKTRSVCLNLSHASAKKVQAELLLSNQLKQLIHSGLAEPKIKQNHLINEALHDLEETGKNAEKMVEKYNVKVRKYNKLTGNFLFVLVKLFVSFKSQLIFEFEA